MRRDPKRLSYRRLELEKKNPPGLPKHVKQLIFMTMLLFAVIIGILYLRHKAAG